MKSRIASVRPPPGRMHIDRTVTYTHVRYAWQGVCLRLATAAIPRHVITHLALLLDEDDQRVQEQAYEPVAHCGRNRTAQPRSSPMVLSMPRCGLRRATLTASLTSWQRPLSFRAISPASSVLTPSRRANTPSTTERDSTAS